MPPSPLELTLPRLQRWMQAVIEQPGEAAEAVNVRGGPRRARSGGNRPRHPALEDALLGRARRRLSGHVSAEDGRSPRERLPGRGPSSRRRRLRRARHRLCRRMPVAQLHAEPPGRPFSRVHSDLARSSAESVRGRSRAPRGPRHRGLRRSGIAELARRGDRAHPRAGLGRRRAPAHRGAAAGSLRVSRQRVPPVREGREPRPPRHRPQGHLDRRLSQELRGLASRPREARRTSS